jgi:D-aminopeptidase
MDAPPPPRGPRLRTLGLRVGTLEPGPHDAITDVPGVAVGHVSVWRDGRHVARTGVTVIAPEPASGLQPAPLPAGVAVLNGAGELTGSLQVREWGELETPVYLTSTHAVGRVYDGAVAAACAADPAIGADRVVIPVVAECDDSGLNDARAVHVEADDVRLALGRAAAGPVDEGAVGAGVGMECFGWKGGIGTASRLLPGGAALGVLVLANFGTRRELRVDGVPVGELLPAGEEPPRSPAGSCVAVIATDAPLEGAQLERVARRAGLGLARTGSVAHHGSGEIFLAFSTVRGRLSGSALDPLFAAVVEATEEAVLNALWAAPAVTGRSGRTVEGLPHDAVLTLLGAHGRLRPPPGSR